MLFREFNERADSLALSSGRWGRQSLAAAFATDRSARNPRVTGPSRSALELEREAIAKLACFNEIVGLDAFGLNPRRNAGPHARRHIERRAITAAHRLGLHRSDTPHLALFRPETNIGLTWIWRTVVRNLNRGLAIAKVGANVPRCGRAWL